MEITIGELHDTLRRQLAAVRSGQTVTVTDHGRPVAVIVPVDQRVRLKQLPGGGRIRCASRPKRPAPTPVPAIGTVSDLIGDQRP